MAKDERKAKGKRGARRRGRRPSEMDARRLQAAIRRRIRSKRRGAERVEGGKRRRRIELEVEILQTMHRVEVEVAQGIERGAGDVDIFVKELDGEGQASCSIIEEQASCSFETGSGRLSFSIDPSEVLLIDGKAIEDADEALGTATAALEGLTPPAALALMSTVEDLVVEQGEGEPDSRLVFELVIRPIISIFKSTLTQGLAREGIDFVFAFLWGVLGWWLFIYLPDTSTLLAEIEGPS